jgi:hypothetical protein
LRGSRILPLVRTGNKEGKENDEDDAVSAKQSGHGHQLLK